MVSSELFQGIGKPSGDTNSGPNVGLEIPTGPASWQGVLSKG